jgi:tetratricopeptide (TPR) repeat protein
MHRAVFICLALIVAVLAVFWQVHGHDFVDFDDLVYVVDNPHVRAGLTLKGIAWAFTAFHAANWHPLTWLSHMLDCQLFGLNPAGHHLTSVLLHLANTLLLVLVLYRMTGAIWRSSLVAALFAIHPLHVESVAWVAERKDVLSTLFWLLTMLAYLGYVKRPSPGRYLLALFVFACGLMAKPMLVTLPFVLLLLDYWPLARIHRGQPDDGENSQPHALKGFGPHPVPLLRLFWEKVPFLALSAVSSVVTVIAQKSGAAIGSLDTLPLKIRLANAVVSYVIYMRKMIWPHDLAAFYPHPGDSLTWWQIAGAGLLLICITLLVVRGARRHPYVGTGWFWYLGTLLPVIGLIQVGAQAMADRYTYVSVIGLCVVVAWSLGDLARTWRYGRIASGVVAGTALFVLTICTWKQVPHWRNTVTLFDHALAVTANNYVAHNNLANALVSQNKLQDAIAHYARAIEIRPAYADAYSNMGVLLARQGKMAEASAYYARALHLKPNLAEAHHNLASALVSQGRLQDAMAHYARAIEIKPTYAMAYNNMATVLVRLGEVEKAINVLNCALRIAPSLVVTHCNLGDILFRQGDLNSAIEHYQEAIGVDPASFKAHEQLGMILGRQGRLAEAIVHLSQALNIEPDHADVHNTLGALLVHQGRLAEAISHFSEALKRSPDDPVVLNNMGEALGRQGNVEGAIQHFSRALDRKPDYADARNNLASLFFQRGRFNEAILHYQKALEFKPGWPEVHNNLGVALARAGRLKEAASHLSEALQLKPDYIEARNNLNRVLKETRESQRRQTSAENQ